MFRFLLVTVALSMVKASHLSYGGGHGLSTQPKFLSQSVHLQEIPTKVIRVTKTVAIKVPVPYPVKVPYHIPVPVPVNHPVAVPVPQIVKVPHQVPIEVSKHIPVELHQQVPFIVSKPVAFPQPVPVPHPVAINRPVYYPVPHPIPYPQHSESEDNGAGYSNGGGNDYDGHGAQSFNTYTVESQGHGGYGEGQGGYGQGASYEGGEQGSFQPSQPDYTPEH